MISIRKSSDIFIHGNFEEVYYKDNIIVFKRILNDEQILVIFNNCEDKVEIELNLKDKGIDLITQETKCLNKIIIEELSFKIYKIINS